MSLPHTGTGPADPSGAIELSFTDSGAVDNCDDYVTVFVIHGSAFTNRTFDALHPLAPSRKVRLVAISRRGYPGSTPYTDEDLQDIVAGKRDFLVNLGREVLHFMGWFVKEHNIPRFDGKQGGGAVLLGWSMGATTLTATLAYPDDISRGYFDALEPFLRTVIFYDPGNASFGIGPPPAIAEQTPAEFPPPTKEFFDFFAMSATSYFTHPDLESRKPEGIDYSMVTERQSIQNWTTEDMEKNFVWEQGANIEYPMWKPAMQETIRAQTSLALLSKPAVFPNANIVILGCTNTSWMMVWGSWEIERLYSEGSADVLRRMNVLPVKGNHFVHVDDPEAFMDVLLESLAL